MADRSITSQKPTLVLPCTDSPIPCATHLKHKKQLSNEKRPTTLSKIQKMKSLWKSMSRKGTNSTPLPRLSSLPVELIQHIASYLLPSSAACLAVTNRFIYAALPSQSWLNLKDFAASEYYDLLRLLQENDPHYFHCGRCERLHHNTLNPIRSYPQLPNLPIFRGGLNPPSIQPDAPIYSFRPTFPMHPRYQLLTIHVDLALQRNHCRSNPTNSPLRGICLQSLACAWSGALPAASLDLRGRGYDNVFYIHEFTPFIHDAEFLLRARHSVSVPKATCQAKASEALGALKMHDSLNILKQLGIAVEGGGAEDLAAAVACKMFHHASSGDGNWKEQCTPQKCGDQLKYRAVVDYELKRVDSTGFEVVTWKWCGSRNEDEGWEPRVRMNGDGSARRIFEEGRGGGGGGGVAVKNT